MFAVKTKLSINIYNDDYEYIYLQSRILNYVLHYLKCLLISKQIKTTQPHQNQHLPCGNLVTVLLGIKCNSFNTNILVFTYTLVVFF